MNVDESTWSDSSSGNHHVAPICSASGSVSSHAQRSASAIGYSTGKR